MAVQEALCFAELKGRALRALGPAYEALAEEAIGSAATGLGFHGFIGLAVFARREDVAAGAVALRLMVCRWLRNGALPPAAPDRVFSGHLERAQDPGSSLPAPREHCPRAFHTKGASGEA